MLIERAIEELTDGTELDATDSPDLNPEAGPFGVVPDDGFGDS